MLNIGDLMLKYTAICDKDILDAIHNEIFGGEYPKAIGFVLYDETKPIGLAQITINSDVSHIEKIGIIPSERGKRNGDFFTRSIIWGLSHASEKIITDFDSSYFTKFGFVKDGTNMMCLSKDVVFPCDCHK